MAEVRVADGDEFEVFEESREGAKTRRLVPKAGSELEKRDQAREAIRSYLDTSAPTNAQTVTVVKALCRLVLYRFA